MNKDLKDKTLAELERIVTNLGGKAYLARYIFSFIHTQSAQAIADISPLSKVFREKLIEQGYFISQLKVVSRLSDTKGSAKFLFELPDGDRVEAVLLKDEQRQTLCVSTQVGCAMGCTFCATGRVKLRRGLTAGEIVDQVNSVSDSDGRISNVVYMGMGEPLENYDATLKSIRILNHASGKNIGIKRITVSTCGVAPGIRRLAREDIHPRLAISLNAPQDDLRGRLMPVNRAYPLAELLSAVRAYQAKTKQRVTFEYVLMDGLNDSVIQARALVELVRGLPCNVNLIEHNPFPDCGFGGSSRDRIQRFATILKDSGLETTIRFRMGRKIKAACGQLQAGYGDKGQDRGGSD